MTLPPLPRWPQLPLGLYPDPGADFASYHAGPNAEAVQALRLWAAGQGPWCLCVWGATEVGKSHLLQAALRAAGERELPTMYLPLGELREHGPAVLEGLEELPAVGLDDLDAVTGDPAWEEALFGLYNGLQAAGGRLLCAARFSPRVAEFALPDLQSRLAAALVFHLQPLDDADKAAAVIAAAARRGLEMPETVAQYLLRRMPRHWSALLAALEALDRASLSAGRALTVPFVREVLRLVD